MVYLEEIVVRKLKTSHRILSTIESCTGGLIASQITNVSGASEIFWGSSIVYDESAKKNFGVPTSLLKQHGAVSPEIALSLAELGLIKMQDSLTQYPSQGLIKHKELLCLSITGFAGPLGGTPHNPVGTCYIGLALLGKPSLNWRFQASTTNNRIQTKIQFANHALELIRAQI